MLLSNYLKPSISSSGCQPLLGTPLNLAEMWLLPQKVAPLGVFFDMAEMWLLPQKVAGLKPDQPDR